MSQLDPVPEANEVSGSGHGNGRNGASGSNGALATIDSHLQSVPALGWSYGLPQRPEILSAKPNPMELLHSIRRRWPLAIGMGVTVATLAAAVVWFLVPVKYEAYALLRVANAQPKVIGNSAETGEAFATFKRTQVQLMLSGVVLRRTVGEPEITKLSLIKDHDVDPASWLKEQLIIDNPDDSEILRVAMKGTKKSEVIAIVNMIVKKYLLEIVAHERDERLKHEAQLEKTYQGYYDKFTKDMDALHLQEQVAKISTTESAQVARRIAQDQLSEAIYTRNQTSRSITMNAMEIAMMKVRKDNPDEVKIPEILIDVELSHDPVVHQMNQRLSQMKEQLSSEMGLATNPNESKAVRSLRQAIETQEEDLNEHKAALRPRLLEIQKAKDAKETDPYGRAVTLPVLEKQAEYLAANLELNEEDVAKATKMVESLESFSSTVTAKQEDLMAQKRIMNDLRQELERIRLERQAQERITKVDDAALATPDGDAMRKYVGVVFSAILGFGLVVVGIAFVEFQSRRVNSTQQVNDGLGVRVVGELPNVSGRTWRRMKGGKGPALLKALMAERIDGARTALIHTTAIEPPRVVMVTSADPHEGKTTTASQLAASLARSGRRTLLIDGDIRNPGAHRVFDMPQEPGLCELLRGEAERDAVIHPTRTANLWLLPGGRCDLRSVQALSSSYLGTAIAALCVQFDYVVIDSGPVLKVADPLLIGQHVDAAIVSVLRDVSKVPNVYEACERMRSVGITVLGSVVNGVNDDVARHGIELLMAETT